jgi:hypothetical protein
MSGVMISIMILAFFGAVIAAYEIWPRDVPDQFPPHEFPNEEDEG